MSAFQVYSNSIQFNSVINARGHPYKMYKSNLLLT